MLVELEMFLLTIYVAPISEDSSRPCELGCERDVQEHEALNQLASYFWLYLHSFRRLDICNYFVIIMNASPNYSVTA